MKLEIVSITPKIEREIAKQLRRAVVEKLDKILNRSQLQKMTGCHSKSNKTFQLFLDSGYDGR